MTQRGAAGRISEWDRIEIGDTGTEADVDVAVQPKVSVTDILTRFRKLAQELNPDRLADLSEKIDEHIAAPSSIHGIDTSALATDGVQGLLRDLVPGTPPDLPPSYVLYFDPPDTWPGVTYTGNDTDAYITNYRGVLVKAPATGLPVDYGVSGMPVVPIFPARSNHWTRSQANHASVRSGSAGSQRIQPSGSTFGTTNTGASALLTPKDTTTPSDEVLHVLGTAADTTHGVTIERVDTYTTDASATVSLYVRQGTRRYLTIDVQNSSSGRSLLTALPVIDLDGKTIVTGSSEIRLHLHAHPSGWLRLGITFTHDGTTNDVFDVILQSHDDISDTSFAGTAGERLFSIFGINVTRGEGMAPYIETTGSAKGFPDSTLFFDISSVLLTTQGMMSLSWIGNGNGDLTSGTGFGGNLLNLNSAIEIFKVTGDGVKTVVSNSDILDNVTFSPGRLVSHAITWGPTGVTSRTTGNQRQTNNSGLTIAGTLTKTTIGPAPGYLRSFLLYTVSGLPLTLDYLLGEAEPSS